MLLLLYPGASSSPSLPARHTPNSPQPGLVGATPSLPPTVPQPPPPPPPLLPVANMHSSRGSRHAPRGRRSCAGDDSDDEGSSDKVEPAAGPTPSSPPSASEAPSTLLRALRGQGNAIVGTQTLELVRGKVNRSFSSRTSHRRTVFDDGKDAQTRKGLLGTGASEVHTAVKGTQIARGRGTRRGEGGQGKRREVMGARTQCIIYIFEMCQMNGNAGQRRAVRFSNPTKAPPRVRRLFPPKN